ncbi:MAG: Spx/MgsR family RNA polymerase-binding regulatory protein [Gammaproteobacteria bacterium]|nr:Spx/MgsR family RNA polymerase-binding regulatory protein [Gammaproteobacteria bacterium]
MTVLYGIRQCDTCRKAIQWLDRQGVEYRFHDLRADGLDAGMIEAWLKHQPLDTLINRRSTTWRALDKSVQARLDAGDWRELLPEHPTLIKRPLMTRNGTVVVGMNDLQAATQPTGQPA